MHTVLHSHAMFTSADAHGLMIAGAVLVFGLAVALVTRATQPRETPRRA